MKKLSRLLGGEAGGCHERPPAQEKKTINYKIACVLAACAATLVAQTPPATILELDMENVVF
ncbi:MAG: hypothetical protein AAB225_13735 [Acidobacteriota bacterium]